MLGGLALCIAGCAAGRPYPAPPQQLVEIGHVQAEGDTTADAPANDTPIGAPRHVLVLSGGGMNGAYSAGILKSWTDSGARPQFDIVTGIRTGAIIAPLTFLGPEHDAKMERLYTSMRQESILRPRLLRIDSVTSSAPLERQITTSATPEILCQIAEAHRSGRRLYVGTTNLDTKTLVVPSRQGRNGEAINSAGPGNRKACHP